jgi:HAD superfamily hydrolase (TIGR01549 family)
MNIKTHSLRATRFKNDLVPKTWVFDLVGTLLETSPSRETIFHEVITASGVSLSVSEIGKALTFVDNFHFYKEFGDRSRKEQWLGYNRRVLQYLSVPSTNLARGILERFESQRPEWVPIVGAIELLNHLKQCGSNVGVASNFSSAGKELLNVWFPTLDFVVLSGAEGVEKPDQKFFEVVTQRAGCKSSDAVFVGDSLILDYIPSRMWGFTGILIDRFGVYSERDSNPSVFESVVALLKRLQE